MVVSFTLGGGEGGATVLVLDGVSVLKEVSFWFLLCPWLFCGGEEAGWTVLGEERGEASMLKLGLVERTVFLGEGEGEGGVTISALFIWMAVRVAVANFTPWGAGGWC